MNKKVSLPVVRKHFSKVKIIPKLFPIRTDDGQIIEYCHPNTGEIIPVNEALDLMSSLIPDEDKKSIVGKTADKSIHTTLDDFIESSFALMQTVKRSPLIWAEKENPDLEVGETDTGHWEQPTVLKGSSILQTSKTGSLKDKKIFNPDENRKFVPGCGCENKLHPKFTESTFQPEEIRADDRLSFIELIWSQILLVTELVHELENSAPVPSMYLEEVISNNLSFGNIKLNLSHSALLQKLEKAVGDVISKDNIIKNLKAKLYKFRR